MSERVAPCPAMSLPKQLSVTRSFDARPDLFFWPKLRVLGGLDHCACLASFLPLESTRQRNFDLIPGSSTLLSSCLSLDHLPFSACPRVSQHSSTITKYHRQSFYKEERLILAHCLGGSSPQLIGRITLDLCHGVPW